MRARRCLSVVLIALGASCSSAEAAPAPASKPAIVVSSGSYELTARDARGGLCLGLSLRSGATAESCSSDASTVAVVAGGGVAPAAVGAAVPAAAVRVEVRRAGVVVAGAPTVGPGAYRGTRAHSRRFVVVRLPEGSRGGGLRVRALDAAGALVAVAAPDDGDLVTGRRILLSGRSGRTQWSVVGQRVSSLAPSLADLEHEDVRQCVVVRVDGSEESGLVGADCAPQDPAEALLGGLLGADPAGPATEDTCPSSFRLLHGSAPSGLTAVEVLLGNGRVMRARVARIPGAARMAYAVVIPAAAAVRSVRLVAPGGARTVALALAPLAVSCADGSTFSSAGFGLEVLDPTRSLLDVLDGAPEATPVGPVTEVPGTPGFRVADGPDGTLCVAVAGHPFTATGCRLVTPGYDESLGAPDSYARPRAFVQVVPAQVATVRISAKGGTPRAIATVAGDGYTGVYAGRVRFAAATVTGFAELRRTELLDASGRVLHTETDDTTAADFAPARTGPPRRLAGTRAHPSLWATHVRPPFGVRRSPCLALTPGAPPAAGARCQAIRAGAATVLVGVPCTTHRLTLAVATSTGARVLADTGRGAPVAVATRRGVAVLTLPAARGLRAVTILRPGRPRVRFAVRAPAGAAQCGWTAVPQPQHPVAARRVSPLTAAG